MKRLCLVALFIAIALTGCKSTPKEPPPGTSVPMVYPVVLGNQTDASLNNQNAQAQLTQASISISNSLQKLAAIEKTTHPGVSMPTPVNPAQIGMAQRASVDWTGPVQPLLQKLANASHYQLKILGTVPAIPVLVSVSAKDETLADILRDVTYQVVKKANIVVYPNKRTIELRYRTV